MPTAQLTVQFTSGSVFGQYDQATGLTYGAPLITSHDSIVPPQIDSSGATEVTDDLQAFLDAQPDGSYIKFQLDGTYYCDTTLAFLGRKGLFFDLNGATITSKFKFPLVYPYANVTITAPGDTGPYTVPGFPPTAQALYVAPDAPKTLGPMSYNEVRDNIGVAPAQDNIPEKTYISAAYKSAGYRIAVVSAKNSTATSTPGTNLFVLFRGANSGLCRFLFGTSSAGVRCQNIKIRNGTLAGSNPTGTYDATVEGQHAIGCNGVDGADIGPLTIKDVWGDGIQLAVDNPSGPGTHLNPRPPGLSGGNACRNIYVHDVTIDHNGRQGMSPTGIINCLIERCSFTNNPRTAIDMEAPFNSVVKNMTIRWCPQMFPHFGFVSLAGYPVGTNVYMDTITLDGCVTHNLGFIANNTLTASGASVRWKNITVINCSDTSTEGVGGSLGYVIEFVNCDHVVCTGNTQEMQKGRGMHFVHIVGCSDVEVHDNDLTCGPAWVSGTHYVQTGPNGPDNVTNDGDAWQCILTHNAGSANEPGVGVNWRTFWQSCELSGAAVPLLFAAFTSGSTMSAIINARASATFTAAFTSGSTMAATKIRATQHLTAAFASGSALAATITEVTPAGILTAAFVSGSTMRARLASGPDFVPDNEFRTGRVATRGPGWNRDRWNTDGWNGYG